MKQVFTFLAVLFFLSAPCFAQSGTTVSELVFQNPVLVSGTAGQDGAVYKFSNVAAGIDATVTVAGRSGPAVVLTNVDVDDMGWHKAFQPQLGIPGNVPGYQDWWMDFELRFYAAGTSDKKTLGSFNATAIDVDGDGLSIQEYLQMNKIKSIAYCPVNYLAEQGLTATSCTYDNVIGNTVGSDKKVMGPVMNFTNIDTLGTPVMAMFTYENKDMIAFRYGARSGANISNAGERLNSLWFKAFNLTPPSTLPIHFHSFAATYDKKKASLNWTAESDENAGFFTVERSTNGTTYQSIGRLPASFGKASYTLTDDNLPATAAIVYYRIQSREKSGETNYSSIKIIRLNQEAAAAICLYPNPVQKTANLTLPAAWQSQPVTVSVYSGSGIEVQRKAIPSAGQTEALDLGPLPKGFYVVKARCNGQWSEERIVKN